MISNINKLYAYNWVYKQLIEREIEDPENFNKTIIGIPLFIIDKSYERILLYDCQFFTRYDKRNSLEFALAKLITTYPLQDIQDIRKYIMRKEVEYFFDILSQGEYNLQLDNVKDNDSVLIPILQSSKLSQIIRIFKEGNLLLPWPLYFLTEYQALDLSTLTNMWIYHTVDYDAHNTFELVKLTLVLSAIVQMASASEIIFSPEDEVIV